MSRADHFNWAPGTKNGSGVYAPTEVLTLPHKRPGWRGCPRVEIDLVQTAEGWRSSLNFQFMSGTHQGQAHPTTDRCAVHPTRELAIKEQADGMRARFAKLSDASMRAEAREMIAWADGLIPAQRSLF